MEKERLFSAPEIRIYIAIESPRRSDAVGYGRIFRNANHPNYNYRNNYSSSYNYNNRIRNKNKIKNNIKII